MTGASNNMLIGSKTSVKQLIAESGQHFCMRFLNRSILHSFLCSPLVPYIELIATALIVMQLKLTFFIDARYICVDTGSQKCPTNCIPSVFGCISKWMVKQRLKLILNIFPRIMNWGHLFSTLTILFDSIRIDEKIDNLEKDQNVGGFDMTDVLIYNQ